MRGNRACAAGQNATRQDVGVRSVTKAMLIAMLKGAGFKLVGDDGTLLPYQTLLTFEKPVTAAGTP